MHPEHGALAELGGEEEAEVSVLGVDAHVDDAAPASAVAIPVTLGLMWPKSITYRKFWNTGPSLT